MENLVITILVSLFSWFIYLFLFCFLFCSINCCFLCRHLLISLSLCFAQSIRIGIGINSLSTQSLVLILRFELHLNFTYFPSRQFFYDIDLVKMCQPCKYFHCPALWNLPSSIVKPTCHHCKTCLFCEIVFALESVALPVSDAACVYTQCCDLLPPPPTQPLGSGAGNLSVFPRLASYSEFHDLDLAR